MASHFDLPGSESVFGISQGPPMCAHASLSQDRFHQKGLWVASIAPLLTSKELSSWEGFLDFENEKYVASYLLSGQGLASSLDCPAVLEFLSTGNELQLLNLGPIYLLPPV